MYWSSCRGTVETNPTRNHEVAGLIPGLNQWVGDLVLPWVLVWVGATAPIWPLAWEHPYAAGAALKRQKKKKKKKEPYEILLTHEKGIWSFITVHMDLECLRLSKRSQTKKDNCHMILLICGIWKTNKTKTHRYREQIGGCQNERGGRGDAKWMKGIKRHKL